MHRAAESAADTEYLDMFFLVGRWTGTPVIGEPDRCSELVWADRNRLPGDLIDYVAAALEASRTGPALLLHGWASQPVPVPGRTARTDGD